MQRGMLRDSLLCLRQDLPDRAVPAVLEAKGDQCCRLVLPVHLFEAVSVPHADAVRPVINGLALFCQGAEKEPVKFLVGFADRGAGAAGPTHISAADFDVTPSKEMIRVCLAASPATKAWLRRASTISTAVASTRCGVSNTLGGLFSATLVAAPLRCGTVASACSLF